MERPPAAPTPGKAGKQRTPSTPTNGGRRSPSATARRPPSPISKALSWSTTNVAPSRRTDPSPLLRRAAEALQAGDLVTAERACRTVLKAAPNHPAGLHLLGLTAKRAGHPEAAADLFRKAVAAAPRYAEAWVNLGRSLLDAGRMEEARDSYRKALQARPHFLPAELGLAQVLKAAGDVAGARTVLEDAQREH